MGNDQAFIFFDDGIRDSINKLAPALLVRVCLTYKEPHPNGLPKQSEYDAVSRVEDELQHFATGHNDWYVGRVTVAGCRYFHIYTSLPEGAWTEFVSGLGVRSGYELSVSFRPDPEHRSYWEELYPTEDDRQVIQDMLVIENLEKHGDDGSAPRKVDHWVYFQDEESAKIFVSWAISDRFTFEPDYSCGTDDGKYCVRLSHVGTIKLGDISSHTIALRRKAAECKGDYDGWEAPVIKPVNSDG